MADNEANAYNPFYYMQQFQQGQASARDMNAQAQERELQNQIMQRSNSLWQQYAAQSGGQPAAGQQPAAAGPNVTVGPWQDSTDPSIGGPTGAPAGPMAAGMALQGGGGPSQQSLPGDPMLATSEKMMDAAGFFMSHGGGGQGLDLLKSAADIRAKGATANYETMRGQSMAADATLHGLDAFGRIMNPSDVTDQASYTTALQQAAAIDPKMEKFLQTVPTTYSKELVQKLSDLGDSRSNQVTLQKLAIDTQMKQLELSNTQANQQMERMQRQQQLEEDKRWHDANIKENPVVVAKLDGAKQTLNADLIAAQGDPIKEQQAQAKYNDQVDGITGNAPANPIGDFMKNPVGSILSAVGGNGQTAKPATPAVVKAVPSTDVMRRARAAIASGANPDAVNARLKAAGLPPIQ